MSSVLAAAAGVNKQQVEDLVEGVAGLAYTVKNNMGDKSTPEENAHKIATWKKEAKQMLAGLTDEAKSTYTDYVKFKTDVKKCEQKGIFPIPPSAVQTLVACLKNAHKKMSDEEYNGKYAITKFVKSLASLADVEKTEFPAHLENIRDCIDDLNIIYDDFFKYLQDNISKITKEYNQSGDKPATLKSIQGLTISLAQEYGKKQAEMHHRIKQLQNDLTAYTVKKIDQMQYAFDKAITEANTEATSRGVTEPIQLQEIKNGKFLAAIPNTLVFFKILASLSGIRSIPILQESDATTANKHGQYGHGFLAKACHQIDTHINRIVTSFQSMETQLTVENLPLTGSGQLKLEYPI